MSNIFLSARLGVRPLFTRGLLLQTATRASGPPTVLTRSFYASRASKAEAHSDAPKVCYYTTLKVIIMRADRRKLSSLWGLSISQKVRMIRAKPAFSNYLRLFTQVFLYLQKSAYLSAELFPLYGILALVRHL